MRCRHVLLATDFSKSSRQSYATAARWARDENATLHLIHVAEPLPPFFDMRGPFQPYLDELEVRLNEEADRSEFAQLEVERRVLCADSPHLAIAEFVESREIDLIVCSSHGHSGVGYLLLGSFAGRVVRNLAVPTLTCRYGRELQAPARILAPMDFSPASKKIVPVIRRLATLHGASVTVLHVQQVTPGWLLAMSSFKAQLELQIANAPVNIRDEFDALVEDDMQGVDCGLKIVKGTSYREICEYAEEEEMDLIAMTTHGWTGPDVRLGNVTEHVLRQAPCAVLTVPTARRDS